MSINLAKKIFSSKGAFHVAGGVEERVANARLQRNDRVILDYILQNKKKACFQTSNEIAELLGVSPSSVVRLPQRLGYENFAAFRRALQEEVSSAGGAFEAIPYRKIDEYEDLSDEETLAAFGQNLFTNVKATLSSEEDRKLAEIADMIVAARRVCIVGFRVCQGFAQSMGLMLACMRPGVEVAGDAQPLVESLVDIGPDDLLLAISFSRYSKDTVFAVRVAHDSGCPVVALTDSYTAPIARGAAKTVVNRVGNMSFFDSHVSFLINMEKILLLVSKRNKKTNEARLMRMEKYLSETGQY